MSRPLAALALLPLGFTSLAADLKPLDHADYSRWKSIRTPILSRDGSTLAYVLAPAEGDGVLVLKNLKTGIEQTVERGSAPRFMGDGRSLVAWVLPSKAESDKARQEKRPAPKNKLALVSVGSKSVALLDGVSAFRLPEDKENWLAIQYETPAGKKGYPLEIRANATEVKLRLEGVQEYVLAKNGIGLAVSFAETDGLAWIDLPSGKRTAIQNEKGKMASLVLSDGGDAAFEFEPAPPAKTSIRLWDHQSGKVRSMPTDWLAADRTITTRAALRFSPNGRRLFFSAAPPLPPAAKPADPTEETVQLDVWNYKDARIQPEQLLQAASDKNRTYLAVWNLQANRVVQLESDEMQGVQTLGSGDADLALGADSRAYEVESGWGRGGRDVSVIDLRTGQRRKLLTKAVMPVTPSPTGRFAIWYDEGARGYFAADLAKGDAPRNITAGIPTPLWSEDTDTPGEPSPFGIAGWVRGDRQVLVYDEFDLWVVDAEGQSKPRCLTDGYGRRWGLVLRRTAGDRSDDGIDPAQPLLLSAVSQATKAMGFFRSALAGGAPQKLRMEEKAFGEPVKAKDADVSVVSRQSFAEYPDLYATDSSLRELKRLTDANPQQAEYGWGDDELVEWTSADGDKLQGVLVKPAGFDPAKRYPMVVTFYERMSSRLHRYSNPGPVGAAGVNPSFMASRGYLVFMPDVKYRVGYPGHSAVAAIVSGTLALAKRPYVDSERVGIVGHSWGGYETAYLVTQTNLFRCAVAGAAVSNMTSAYSGIRWGSGKMRQFQYEIGQSRIGGSLWQDPLQYIENSPVFWADRVRTPILLLHNDKDGAVPWEQGIEFFGALRRLGKPVWMLNYNGEDHGLGKAVNRKDWTIRMTQFFDHYLKGAPEPVWLADGIPATQKGKTLGLELKGK